MRGLAERGVGRGIVAAVAAAVALGAGPAAAKDIKVCLIAGKTGPLEAYAKQTENGFMMGLEYLTKGTMKVGDDKIEMHRQGRPAQARPRQVAAGGMLRRRQGRHRRRHHRLAGRAGDAAGRRGAQEGADRRAGGGQLDHRRQVEPLRLPHRPLVLPGRAGRRRRVSPPTSEVSIGMLGLDTAFGRDGVKALQGGAGGAPPEGQGRRRGIRRGQHRGLHAIRRAAVQRAEGQARQDASSASSGRARIRWRSSST